MIQTQIVTTQAGDAQGYQQDRILVWKGIPYAQPPIGPLRFRPPQPVEPWTGIREARQFGPVALQPIDFLYGPPDNPNEDCLYLNIWSPGTDGAHRPVMFWIHGGGFLTGAGSLSWFDGASLAARGDVVVVTINYRLGAAGFLALGNVLGEDYASSGNNGILDQLAALTWVHDNIAAFGGDPENVTIFGQSAGAISVLALMAMQKARPVFRRAIIQSGTALHGKPLEQAYDITRQMLHALDIPVQHAKRLLEVSSSDLLKAQSSLKMDPTNIPFCPVIDQVVFPASPLSAISSGETAGIDLLIGTNRDEAGMFLMLSDQLLHDLPMLWSVHFGERAEQAKALYEATYANDPYSTPMMALSTDSMFRIPCTRMAEQRARQETRTWMYRFDWPSSAVYAGRRIGACHSLELPFSFDNLDKPAVDTLAGDASKGHTLAERMCSTWVTFARSGDLSQVEGLPAWAPYDLEHRTTMLFNEVCEVENDPQAATRKLWENR